MSLTVRKATDQLLTYLEPDQRNIPVTGGADNPLTWCLSALNGAMEVLTTLGPADLRARRSATVYPATSVVITTASVGAKTCAFTSGWATWMIGCSIFVTGEKWNRIVNYAAGVITLERPFANAGSAVAATVYCDCIVTDSDIIEVFRPVTLADYYDLSPAYSLAEIQAANYRLWNDNDTGPVTTGSAAARILNSTGVPTAYYLDTHFQASLGEPQNRMMLAPTPTVAGVLSFSCRLSFTRFVLADIYDAGTPSADPGTVIPIRAFKQDAVFMAVAAKRFAGSPFFKNAAALVEINEQYAIAKQILGLVQDQAADPEPKS